MAGYWGEQFSLPEAELDKLPLAIIIAYHSGADPLELLRINPYEELEAMDLKLADLPVLVPFLTDDAFMPTRDLGPCQGPPFTLHRVNAAVAILMDRAAKRELAQLEAYYAKDAEGRRKHLDDVAEWCRKHATMPRGEFLLEVLAETADRDAFAEAAEEAVAKHVDGTVPVLIKRLGSFPGTEGWIARLCCLADSADAVPTARGWLASTDSTVRFWAGLILLRHGDKKRLEGLTQVESVLANGNGCLYLEAIDSLLATKNERAMALACGVLAEKTFVVEHHTLRPILQKLFLAGRRECLDYFLAKLDSQRPIGKQSGTRDGKKVERSLVEGDRIAQTIAFWQGDKPGYDLLAPDTDRRARRTQLAAWLSEQFSLIKAGKTPDIRPEPPVQGVQQIFTVTPGLYIDSQ